MKFWIKRRFQ